MKSSTLIKILVAAAMILFIVNKFITVKGTKNVYESHRDGYMVCEYVNGIHFDVPANVRNVQIENDMFHADSDYLNGAWVISTGETYMAFQYDYMVIIAAHGTSFLKYENTADAFRKVPIMSTWLVHDEDYFEKDGKVNDSYKRIASVVADVSINPEFYGTYAGRWAAITRDDDEWSIFIGYRADSYGALSSDQKDVVGHVCASLICTDSTAKQDVNNTPVPTEEPTAVPATETPTPTPVPTVAPTATPLLTVEATPAEADAVIIITSEPVNTSTPTPTVSPTPTTAPTPTQAVSVDTGKDSNCAAPLKLGEKGKCYEPYVGGVLELGITPKKLYVRNEAKELLNSLSVTEEAPAGTKWQVVEFISTASPELCQTYCELLGTDGGTLVYAGVINSTRTHVVSRFAKKDGDEYGKFYVYYPIPNGCKEYELAFGSAEAGNRAYFLFDKY
ncbi:MAG: hypothetical protein J6Y89_00800 [Lachnospiraceae bacterium]|nr:hypothetical protein [Lachnospiraceae bacterium]